jgi:hypothetical protein
MDDHMKHRPSLGKERNELVNAIVNRSRKRKSTNQNQNQTRKNKESIQSMLATMKKSSPEYSKKQEWLTTLSDYLHPGEKPKRKFKVREAALEAISTKTLEKTKNQLKENKVVVPLKDSMSPKNAVVTVTEGTAKKKRVFKVRAEEVAAPTKAPSPVNKATFPILYTKSKTGKIQQWSTEVKKNANGTATITTQWGYKDGKLAVSEKDITEGKNKGKSNETTPFQQAVSEAQSAWEKKTSREGYAEKLENSAIPGVAEDTKVTNKVALYPMLAQNYRKQSRKVIFPCYVQAKLDGVRSLYRNGVFTSRTAKPFGILDHIIKELQPATDAGLILDGEIYSTTLSFQEFVGLVKKKHLTAKDKETIKHVKLWVYDVVNDHPFEQRLALLVDFFSRHSFTNVFLLPTEEAKTKDDIKKFHDKYVEAGYEGVIIRNKKGMYRLSTRSEDLQKFKEFEDSEFVIVGFTEGDGNEKGAVIWICETEDKKQFRVRPKGTIEDRRDLFRKADTLVGKKLTVKYQELTDDGIPRFPIGLAIRDYE